MLLRKKEGTDIDKFWREYEEKIHEKVLARTLGRYISGWAEYTYPLWGLVMATTGGFRFHHFPHEGWLTALTRITTGGDLPEEKTFFIPRESIVSAKLVIETRWWKKILSPAAPALVIHYRLKGTEEKLLVETDRQAASLVENLTK
ncbi:MAG: hypothetical protein LBP60_09435 [Spirochaetaceae bacterium]|jgi:hypothetical protein|nr:hypothetical protein [Spirochaetaceae bacterium]